MRTASCPKVFSLASLPRGADESTSPSGSVDVAGTSFTKGVASGAFAVHSDAGSSSEFSCAESGTSGSMDRFRERHYRRAEAHPMITNDSILCQGAGTVARLESTASSSSSTPPHPSKDSPRFPGSSRVCTCTPNAKGALWHGFSY